MYDRFSVTNYRCFEHLNLSDTRRVNVIAGKNSVGKSSLLEAIWLHGGGLNPELALRVNAMRGIEQVKMTTLSGQEGPWNSIFRDFDVNESILLEGTGSGREFRRSTRIRVPRDEELKVVSYPDGESPTWPTVEGTPVAALEWSDVTDGVEILRCVLRVNSAGVVSIQPAPRPMPFQWRIMGTRVRMTPSEDAELLGLMFQKRRESALRDALRAIYPEIERVVPLPQGSKNMIFADIGHGQLRPLVLMGEGLARIASIVVCLSECEGGALLIDEVENGFHHTVQRAVWDAIRQMSREFNCQVFATTHSVECIKAAKDSFEVEPDAMCLYRLQKDQKGAVQSVRYAFEDVDTSIKMEIDVR